MIRRQNSKQLGMSLIEMMISVVIGLVIIAGVVNIFIASRQSTQFSDGLRSMQDNGRQTAFVLKNAILHAGMTNTDGLQAVDLAASGDDQITLQVQSATDCIGENTAAAAIPGIAVNRYFFDDVNDQVLCQGNVTGATMVIADNVEMLRFLYGLDEDFDPDAQNGIERYVSFAEVSDANEIAAIKFGVLVATDGPVKDLQTNKTYTVLNDSLVANDRIGRQVFHSSAIIRNKRE